MLLRRSRGYVAQPIQKKADALPEGGDEESPLPAD